MPHETSAPLHVREATPMGDSPPVPVSWQTLSKVLVVLGVILRTIQFGRNPSMWHDEAALVLNVIQKGFTALLGPLLHAEAAPPLFLWLERAVVVSLGDGTYALRLIPYLASCAMVVLMWITARRLLDPQATVWAVLLLAGSERLLWHACEAKPYALDALLGLTIISLHEFSRSWELNRRLLVFILAAPVVIWLSFPGCFLYGGVLLVLFDDVRRKQSRLGWSWYGLLVLVVFAAFGGLFWGPIQAQRNISMDNCWNHTFPDWQRPWLIPWWFAVSTVEVADYCLRPLGGVLTGVALVGGFHLWRQGRRPLVILAAVPALLAAVAALLHAYPYTGARVMVYALPGIVLLTAAGVRPLLAWVAAPHHPWSHWGRHTGRVFQWLVLVPLLAPMILSLYRTAQPWPRADTAGASAYVMAERRPEDAVVGNHWEYEYYFRHLGPAYHLMERWPDLKDSGERVWVVVTSRSAPERITIIRSLLQDQWEVATQREFSFTSVALLVRSDPDASALDSLRPLAPGE
ncbi:MAG TPA: hypothetical protein DCE18_00015 [Syntrophobacteraceae bacterium]|nr:hypothetical protein [Syntrophobacteraceae bacterium]